MIKENIVETRLGTLHKVFVILSANEESLYGIFNIVWRFLLVLMGWASSRLLSGFRMTNIPLGRNDNKVVSNLNSRYKGFQLIISMVLILILMSTSISAQNIMQINNVHGVISSTVTVPISITNEEEFISFQCDLILPDGFVYVAGSITLTPRSVDHVVNVTNIGNNTIRLLSYSLNNTTFLLDSGVVARVSLSTPETEGDYIVGIENGIIGNAQSINILDSIVAGEITLGPIGVLENNVLEDKIKCFPNPTKESLIIQIDVDCSQLIKLKVFDLMGLQLSNLDLKLNNIGINKLSFDIQNLLGNNASNGTYIFQFSIQDKNQIYSIVKNIQYKK